MDIKSPNFDFPAKLDTALMHQAALAERHCLEYAKELSRSIHLNPFRAKIVETPEQYDWSSYKFYIGKQGPAKWLYRDFILGYFGKKVSSAQKGYQKFVNALALQEYDSPLDEVVSSTLLGSAIYQR